jgi:plastocyanin
MRRALSLAALISLLAWSPSSAKETTVQVGHNRVEPAEVTIAVGDTVVFKNQDQMPGGHTLVADDGSFASPPLAKDQSWSHSFQAKGTYPYHIKEHAGAKGKVVVE